MQWRIVTMLRARCLHRGWGHTGARVCAATGFRGQACSAGQLAAEIVWPWRTARHTPGAAGLHSIRISVAAPWQMHFPANRFAKTVGCISMAAFQLRLKMRDKFQKVSIAGSRCSENGLLVPGTASLYAGRSIQTSACSLQWLMGQRCP